MEPLEIDLQNVLLANRPAAFPERPGERVVLVTDVIAQLDAAKKRGQPVILTVRSGGGSFTAGVDLWATLRGFRPPGPPAIVEVWGRALSAAALAILGASHILVWPWSRIGLHGPWKPASVPDPDLNLDEIDSSCVRVLLESGARGVTCQSMVRALLEQSTFGTPEQIEAWTGSQMVYVTAEEALQYGFADELLEEGTAGAGRAREIAVAYGRGETLRSPRREALQALGRGGHAGEPAR